MRTLPLACALLAGLGLAACEQRGLTWTGTGALSEAPAAAPTEGAAASALARSSDRSQPPSAGGDAAPGPADAAAGPRALAPRAPAEGAGPAAGAPRSGGRPGFGARQELGLGGKGAGLVRVPGPEPLLAVVVESPGALLLVGPGPGGAPAVRERLAADGWCLPPVLASAPDGTPRLALASRETARLSIFDPAAPALPPFQLQLPSPPVALAAGDLGADGSTELLVLTRDGQLIAVDAAGASRSVQLEGERGTFLHVAADGSAVHVGWQLPRSLSAVPAARLAGDTDAPIVRWTLPGVPRAMVELDLDRDGDLERAVAGGERELWAFGMDGADVEGEPRTFELPGDLPIALLSADIDADGDTELLSINRQDSNYGVLGEWSRAQQRFDLFTSEYAGQSPLDLELCDLDGDGALDLCIVGRDSAALGVTRGSGQAGAGSDPFIEASRLPVGTNPLALAAADVDGDGRAEAVALCGGDGSLHVLGAPRPGAPLAPLGRAALGSAPRRALLGVRADGRPALAALLMPTEGSRVVRLSADAAGQFAREGEEVRLRFAADIAAHGPAPYGAPGSALLAVDPASRGLALLAVGSLEPAWFELAHPAPSSVARLDGERLLVAGGEQGRAWVALLRLALDASGAPADAPEELAFVEFEGWPIDLDAAGDGAYLLLGTSAGLDHGRLRALRVGPSSLQAGPEAPTGARPARVAVGDLDRDGTLDAALAAQNSHRLELYFLELSPAPRLVEGPRASCGLGPLDVALADVNADGWLDLLSANAFSHDVSVVRALPPSR